ncbi:MAG: hypothetical protein AAF763_02485 [Pseudomonadota bacterium]
MLGSQSVPDAAKVLASHVVVSLPSVGASGSFWSSYEELGTAVGGSRAKAGRALQALKAAGFLTVSGGGGGRGRSSTFHLAFPPNVQLRRGRNVVALPAVERPRERGNRSDSETVSRAETVSHPSANRLSSGTRNRNPERIPNARERADAAQTRRRPPTPMTYVTLSSSIQRWRGWLARVGVDLETLGPGIVCVPERKYCLPFDNPPPPSDEESIETALRFFDLRADAEVARQIAAALAREDAQRVPIARDRGEAGTGMGTHAFALRGEAAG